MAEEFQRYAIFKRMFTQRSCTECSLDGCQHIVLDKKDVSTILDEMGAHVDRTELRKTIDTVAPKNEGVLTFEQYTKLCDHFVKDPSVAPTALEFQAMNDFAP